MSRLSNDEYYLSLLPGVANRSTCLRRAVGAIIVDVGHRVLSMGFNGVPIGFPHCGVERNLDPISSSALRHASKHKHVLCQGMDDPKGDTRRCNSVHAEINALLTCADLQRAHTMYVSCSPCRICALAIANTNIKRVVCQELYADDARHILAAAGISLVFKGERESKEWLGQRQLET